MAGIAIYRLNMALIAQFRRRMGAGLGLFLPHPSCFALQLVFGLIGYAVMKRFGYFEHYIAGEGRSPGSFALICPGVALFVFANFLHSIRGWSASA